ncbi:hypothetical protein SY212_04350 [Ligilactobacillus agilis]|uniref:Uncharacterized protein n=1 Tax=Ligilactobacillus agilis TaxID=1601 RepID=A0A6F9XJM6_9LACO|nr:hypothetical protein [Ligilactobacillus agilis]GET05405.1 hypothetical protein SY212_04350 [Ligilactobacillus agilis]
MELINDWINLSNYDQRKDYNFIKANRELLQSKDVTAEEKGLYILLLINAQQINTSKAYVKVGIDDLIDMSSDSDDIRTINNQRKIILTILNKLKERGIVSDKIVDNKLTTCINVNYTPFTQIYLVSALDMLSKLKVRSIKRALRNIAIYGFVVASAGADNTPHAHIYVNGLYYMSKHMSIPYETLRKNIDYLVDRQILARRVRVTKDKRKHTLLTTYTELDIQQLDNYVNSVFGKQPKQQQQQKEQNQETPKLVDDDSDNTPAETDKIIQNSNSYLEKVAKYLRFNPSETAGALKIVNSWKRTWGEDVVLRALEVKKYKIAEFIPKSDMHMINWVNRLIENEDGFARAKNGLDNFNRVEKLREQGKIVEDKDMPMTQIDLDTPDPNYQRQGGIAKDASEPIEEYDDDIDLDKLADEVFGI